MRMRSVVIPVLVCSWVLLFATAGCSIVRHSVIQGTGHGSPNAVLPASSQYEVLSLKTRDGTKISAQFGPATDANGVTLKNYQSCPTVVYCYPGGMDMQRSAPQFEGFRHLGMNVIMPEYTGFGMSSGKATEKGCYAAADAAYDYVLSRADLDHAQIIAAGWSVGGGAAVDLASRRSAAGLIIVSTSTKISDAVRYFAAHRKSLSWLPGWTVTMFASQPKLNSLGKIPSVSSSILIIYGTKDAFVSKAMVDKFATAANARTTVVPIEGARHNDIFRIGGASLWQSVRGWIDETLHRSSSRAQSEWPPMKVPLASFK